MTTAAEGTTSERPEWSALTGLLAVVAIIVTAVWFGWRITVAMSILRGAESSAPTFDADPSAPYSVPQSVLEEAAGSAAEAARSAHYDALSSLYDTPSVLLILSAAALLLLAGKLTPGSRLLGPSFVILSLPIGALFLTILVFGTLEETMEAIPFGDSVDQPASFEMWAEERYGLDIEVQGAADLAPGTEFGLSDGRIAVVEEKLVGDGTSATSGLILVERAPEDAQEFPVTGDGH